ncbi:hypothetical protein ACFY8W_36235 [Streptomyces sp. NPDC012637]|uniref:hypothetical protein n=1 Tax=Streptomyces sp. NPDC012637 TaxID=3364842 RepID=UPI0036E69BCA
MTRRALGTGPQVPDRIHAAQADLLDEPGAAVVESVQIDDERIAEPGLVVLEVTPLTRRQLAL